jgi:hypothetical protein
MPAIIPALAATAFTIGSVAVSYGAILQASVVVVGAARARRQARKAERQAAASLQDRTTPVRQSDAARTIVYGSTRVSGPIIYHKSHGDRRERVSHVIALAGHELTAVDDVWFNDKSIKPWTDGYVTTGSAYLASRPMSDSVLVMGTGNGQTITLPLNGGTLIAVDTVAYGEAIVEMSQDGLPVVRDVAYTVLTPTQYSISGNVVTISTPDTNTHPITVTYRVERGEAKAAVWAFLGTAAGQRDTNLETWSNGEWASTAVGNNVARLHVLTVWDETMYATGFPSVSAIVRGKKVYDPTKDSTNGGSGSQRADTPSTWAYSDNPALCAADYLRSELGFGCSSTEIDWPSVAAAANVCDELVPIDAGTGTQKRYTCAGVLSTETERRANLEAILDSMVGIAVYSAGRWSIRAGAYVTPTLDLDEGDLAGGEISIQARANRRDLFNAVRGRYRDPAQLYQVTDFPPYASSTYATEDGGETIYREIDLDMVDDARRAQRIAKLILFRARQALTIQATFKLSAYALQPGDTCRLTIARYGWTNKVFRVLRREFANLTTVRMTLQEDASAIYSWSFNEAVVPDPAPNTALPDPRYVAVPGGVTFKSDTTTFYARADGTYSPYVEVAWTVPAQDDVYVEVFWKRATDTEYQRIRAPIGASYVWIDGVANGDVLNVYLQAVNGIGARSAIFWRPSYVVAAVSQPQSAGIVAANWIENSTCYNGFDGWFAPTGPNLELRHTRVGVAGAQYVLAGTPEGKGAGLHLHETGDRPANGVADAFVGNVPRMIQVEPGQRIEGSIYLSTHRCTADVRVSFYRADGSYLTESLLWGPGTVSPEATLQTLSQYGRRGGFATVPAGAARAVLFFRKYGRNSGTTADGSDVYATRFYLGPALEGQVDLSPWTDGPLRTVGGDDIDPGATRRIDSPVILSFGSISGSVKEEWTAVGADASVANFEGAGRRMLVTVTGNVSQFSDSSAKPVEVLGRVQLIGAETINSDSRTLLHIPATATNSTTPYKAGFDATFSFVLPAPLVNAGGTRYLIRFMALLPAGTVGQVVAFNALTVNFDIAR